MPGGQQPRPTSGLQRSRALTAGGVENYAVTLMKAAPGLTISFTNIDVIPINIFAAAGVNIFAPPPDATLWHSDTINGLANSAPYVLEPGTSVVFTGSRSSWSTS